MDARSVNNTLMIKERIFPLIRGKEHQIVFDPGSLFEIFPHDIRNKQGKEIIVVDAIIPRYAILSIFNDNLLDMFQSSEKFILRQFFKRKGFLFDKHETWYPCYFLINSVLMSIDKFTTAATTSNDAELFFGEIVYYDSCLNFNKHLDDHAEHVNFILDDLSNKMFAETEKFAFGVFDLVFQVIVVKAQGIQDKELHLHSPKLWLFHVWLKKIFVQADLELMKYLNEQHAKKRQCQLIFDPGRIFRIQMKRGRFPAHTKINAYKTCSQVKYNVSSSFNVSDLVPLIADEADLGSNPFQEGEDDMIMDSIDEPEHELELVAADAKLVPEDTLGKKDVLAVPRGPMTRARAKLFNKAIGGMLRHLSTEQEDDAYQTTLVSIQAI